MHFSNTYATESSNSRLADRVPGRPATHTLAPYPAQAVASADQCIYLYAAEDDKYGLGPEGEPLNPRRRVADNPPSGFRYLAKCSGHSSTVNHLDWSTDSRVLQSNDQSYELLYWQADRLSPVSVKDEL